MGWNRPRIGTGLASFGQTFMDKRIPPMDVGDGKSMDATGRAMCQCRSSPTCQHRTRTMQIHLLFPAFTRRIATFLHRQVRYYQHKRMRTKALTLWADQHGRIRPIRYPKHGYTQEFDATQETEFPKVSPIVLQPITPNSIVHRHEQPERIADRHHRKPTFPLRRSERKNRLLET